VLLGQGIGEMVEAVRDRVEVSWHGEAWHITAGSFDGALGYARERFGDPVVLSRKDRGRWWPRVTLVVTQDQARAASAPPLEDLAHPAAPVAPAPRAEPAPRTLSDAEAWDGARSEEEPYDDEWSESDMPAVLEAMFARQDAAGRIPRQRRGA